MRKQLRALQPRFLWPGLPPSASRCRAVLLLAAALACAAPRVNAQTNPDLEAQMVAMRKLGSFPWDTSNADVLLQQISTDGIRLQVCAYTDLISSAGLQQIRTLPTGTMEAWFLSADGTALEQTSRHPLPGGRPVGASSGGAVYSCANFSFKLPANVSLAAAVVKMEDRIHLFPTGKTLFPVEDERSAMRAALVYFTDKIHPRGPDALRLGKPKILNDSPRNQWIITWPLFEGPGSIAIVVKAVTGEAYQADTGTH